MGCGSCGTKGADGKPSGCNSNGGCSTGGCNRLNVFNWLSDIPFSDFGTQFPIVEISFSNGSRKDFFKNHTAQLFEKGQWVAVEGIGGFDIGQISLTGELVKLQMKKYGVQDNPEMKKVLRPAAERDLEQMQVAKEKERDTMIRARAIAKELNLEMKIAEVEFQADTKKVTFFYTADNRVDFRELIKVFASEFKSKIEMRQIGARQESAKVGGVGSCGRELCCSSWLSDFKTVNTTAARYQNLSINQTKLSGQCGRLKCCLNYELDTYMDALHGFPEGVEQLEVAAGRLYLQKKDIFKSVMWYNFSGSSKAYPLSIERVQEIATLNKAGEKPEEIEPVEIQIRHKDAEKAENMGFVNDVGQLTLSSLSKSAKKKQKQKQGNNPNNGQGNNNKPQQKSTANNGAAANKQQTIGNPNREDRPKEGQQRQQRSQDAKGKDGGSKQQSVEGNKPPQNPNRNNQQGQNGNSAKQRPPRPERNEQKQGETQVNAKPPANIDAAGAKEGSAEASANRPPRPNHQKRFKNKPNNNRPDKGGENSGAGNSPQQ